MNNSRSLILSRIWVLDWRQQRGASSYLRNLSLESIPKDGCLSTVFQKNVTRDYEFIPEEKEVPAPSNCTQAVNGLIQNYENLVPFCNEEVQPSFSHLHEES